MKDVNNNIGNYGFKNEKHKNFPPMIFAEITNVCNLKCIHCPYSQISQKKFYEPRHMNFGIYRKIIDEACEFNGVIFRLVCDGEPMLHPDLFEMVMYAKQKGISPICLNTNGTLLDKKASEEILHNGIDVIEISLDAFQKETYERLRIGADYDHVISNVHRFIKMRNESNFRTKIMVSIIDQPDVKSEIEEFIAYWTPKVDRVITRTYTSIGGLVDSQKMKIIRKTDRWPCPLLWTRIFINVDGLIKFCVEDWFDDTVIGNIRNETLKYVWNSDRYQRLRECHLTKTFDVIPYCKKCIDWPARQWYYDYFYALNKVLETN